MSLAWRKNKVFWSERITKSVESLRKVVELMQVTEEIKRIAGGNGNLKRR